MPTPNPVKPRIDALDQTKGILVILMVIYHSLNYTNEYFLSFKYLSFLPPSFIFITGYLISSVYFVRAAGNQSQVQQRLLIRGGKLLLLFTLLNVGAHLLIKRELHGERLDITGFFDHWYEVYLTGAGRFAVFEVLLPIAYALILASALTWAGDSLRWLLPILVLILLVLCTYLEHQGVTLDNLNLLSSGIIGMVVGRLPAEKINSLGRYVFTAIMAYGAYYYIGATIGQYYLVQMLGATVALTSIFSLCLRLQLRGPLRTQLILLGQYSLISYIFQIGVLQGLSRLVHRPAPISFGGLFLFAATLLLTLFCVHFVEWSRCRFAMVERLYKAVFA